jgi:hypothetical protein
LNEALFVFSTGRCGTQWLARVLGRSGGERVQVTHEPLHSDYASRAMLGAGDPSRLDPGDAQPILEHVAHIEATLATGAYIECGHPSWSSLSYLLRRFAGRVRVLHLVRHPVPTAWSWVTHRAYCPPLGRGERRLDVSHVFEDRLRVIGIESRSIAGAGHRPRRVVAVQRLVRHLDALAARTFDGLEVEQVIFAPFAGDVHCAFASALKEARDPCFSGGYGHTPA